LVPVFPVSRVFTALCCIMIWLPCISQSALPDSLQKVLATTAERDRAAILNEAAARILEDDPAEAERLATEAARLAGAAKQRKEEARACCLVAESHVIREDYAASIPWYERSAELELQIGGKESENYANRIGDIGYAIYTMEQPVRGLPYLQESLELSLKGGFHSQAASMYSNIGVIYTVWGDYGKALLNNQMALVIDRRIADTAAMASDLNNIGKIYEQWGKFDLAVKYYREALELAKKVGNNNMVAVRLNNLGIVYKAWKKYPEALGYFRQALEIDREAGNEAKVGKRLSYIGATYVEMGDYVRAFDHLEQARPLVEASQSGDEIARLYNLYGRYYLAVRNYQYAVDFFSRSLDYATLKNIKPLRMGDLKGIADAYEQWGRSHLALNAMKQYLALRDSIFTEESDHRMAEFQARFENDKMRLENDLLKKDARLRSNMYLITGIIAIGVMIILAALAFILKLRHRNALQAKELAERNAERFRDDLETRNRELALQAMMIIKNNETIASVIEGLDKNHHAGEGEEDLEEALRRIRHLDKDKSWKEFEVHFTRVHTDFYSKLNERFPGLTPNERKLCAFLRMNMTTKDIASITHQSVHSINVARTRLRRKLNLANSDDNLVSFLMNL